MHFFPTLFAFPFLMNRFLPERAARQALLAIRKRDLERHEKFPAYYSWCRGPTGAQIQRLTGLGWEIVDYVGLFGHGYYANIPVLRGAQRAFANMLVRHPLPWLTSYAYVVLRRPLSPGANIIDLQASRG